MDTRTGAVLTLRLLGGLEARTADDRDVTPPGKKLRALVACLALQPANGWSRERLMTLLWGDRDEEQARGSLRQALAELRRSLGEPVAIQADRETIAFDPAAISVDAVEFARLAAAGELEGAAALYRGDLLDGVGLPDAGFADWLLVERTRLHDLAVDVLARLAASQEGESAVHTAQRLLQLDPLREETHRTLMRLYAATGQRAQALRQYQICRDSLQRELDVKPEAETEQLHREIQADKVARSSASTRPATAAPASMPPAALQRHLAAILAADVVGFSSLMERDETGTFQRLRTHRKELFEPKITQHNGRIFKLMGDGLLAEFGSVVDAVECAVDLQRGMAERNAGLPDDQRIDCRIGINLGDVIIENDDRHGEGVIIAARLQQLAEKGGIAVSRTVADHVRHKLALHFESLGEHPVKNAAEPVEVCRVRLELPAVASVRWRNHPRSWLAAAALVLIVGTGAAWHFYGTIYEPPTRGQGIPVIAVLPFQDLTGNQASGNAIDLKEVGKGIAEEFTTDLAAFPDFEVVSSTSATAYAGKPIPEIVKATGALFIIEGSIREADGKLMVTMQLINGQTDRHLRIAQFEEKMTDPVALQSATASRLRDELGGMTGILRDEYNKMALAKSADDRTEYDYYALGHIYHLHFDEEDVLCARKIWDQGLARYPDSALLRYKQSFTYMWAGNNRGDWAAYEVQRRLVEEGAKLPNGSRLDEWYSHLAASLVHLSRREFDRAIVEAKASARIAPYDGLTQANVADILDTAFVYDDAIPFITFATTHDPHPRDWYFQDLIDIYNGANKWPDAIQLAEGEIRDKPSPNRNWYKVLATAYQQTGESKKSTEAWNKLASLPDPPAEWQPPPCEVVLNQ